MNRLNPEITKLEGVSSCQCKMLRFQELNGLVVFDSKQVHAISIVNLGAR